MRIFVIFLFFLGNLFAEQIVNGDVFLLRVASEEAGKLYINEKRSSWYDVPNSSDKIAFISTNYRNKNDVVVKNIVNGKTNKLVLKAIKGNYKQEQLTVAPGKVNPPKEVQARIKSEYEEASQIYAIKGAELLFSEPFIYPLNSHITSNFGNARMFNGTLKSYHSGTDYRAAIGTAVPAANDGIVKIAKERYYAGGSVVIDHGGGIYSQYYHLSEINVKVGDFVKKGDIIALSGATGRVSGPHLHFGIVVNGNSINPQTFVEKINSAMF